MTKIYNWAKEHLKPEDGGWLAGFIAGEGCFLLQVRKSQANRFYATPRLHVSVRTDDRGALEEIKRLWQLPNRITRYSNRRTLGSHPMYRISIAKVVILRNRIVPTFRLYPLRAKKHREFKIWAEAIEILYQKQITKVRDYKPWEIERLRKMADELQAAREFVGPRRESNE